MAECGRAGAWIPGVETGVEVGYAACWGGGT